LDRFDQYVKRELRCRYYGRYVDDFYIIHPDRRYLEELIVRLKEFLQSELHLTLHPKKIVLQPYNYGVAFLGAYVKPYRRYATKSSVKRFHVRMSQLEAECRHGVVAYTRLTEIRAVLNSYCGHFIHFKAFRMLQAQFRKSPLNKYFDFSGNYRKAVIKEHFLPGWTMPFEEDNDER
ncbi:MAG: RNA-directed DNA polymerase, partial [Alistipes sp.]|nr:RNA-directed DNA polymerase [Alistipes sp.]